MSDFSINQIDHFSPLLDDVRRLADQNTSTLGFLPAIAFKDYAIRKGVLVIIDNKNNHLAGYLLYRVVERNRHAIIVHLCIDSKYRGQGLAELLFEELRQRTQALRGIGLLCRRDYEHANKLWHRLGFTPKNVKRGRGQTPTELTFWWFDHYHKTLFDIVADTKPLKVIIDANVFFDIIDIKRDQEESLALTSDWLMDDVQLLITPELEYEINRKGDIGTRKRNLQKAHEFAQSRGERKDFEKVYAALKEEFPLASTESRESDIKQLSWAIVDPDVNFFITRDEDLVKYFSDLCAKYDLLLYNPVDLILHLDELHKVQEYKHMRLAGTNINLRRIQAGEIEVVAEYFQHVGKEKRPNFIKHLRRIVSDVKQCECYVVESETREAVALFAYDRTTADELTIPLFRVSKDAINKTFIRYFLLRFLALSAEEHRSFTRLTDPHIQEITEKCLQEDGFMKVDETWVKPNILIAESAKIVGDHFERAIQYKGDISHYYKIHLSILHHENSSLNTEAMVEIERLLWPAKITDADIPTFSIPINHYWASRWFDEKLAKQTLFGAEKELAFNREGVYYSSATRLSIPSLPARVVWYITKDENLGGTGSIRACSRLDDVVIGKPKDLFRQFKHLGIYEWRDIYGAAKEDLEKHLVVFKFSDTQLFTHPVSYSEWQTITMQDRGKKPPIYSPTPMPKSTFQKIYKLGMNLT
jgi:GNAT superfamily N-acetyltransferase